MGVGGVAAIVGGVFGGLALGAKGAFNDACQSVPVGADCTTDQADKTKTNAILADALLIGGGVLVVAGAVVMATYGRGPANSAKAPIIAPMASPYGAGLAARWQF